MRITSETSKKNEPLGAQEPIVGGRRKPIDDIVN
jgi:hypothetical protein